MSEYAALHNVSLLLVGSNIQVRDSAAASERDDLDSIFSDDTVTDDELFVDCKINQTNTRQGQQETTGIETIMQPKQEKEVLVIVDDVASGPDDARWRVHGLERRRKILDDDLRNGGRDFSLSYECSVQRYYSVAHWALEQFHQLYERSSSIHDQHQLEEIYVMGYRIISFLTECLPNHPGLSEAPYVQEQSMTELKHLRKCLEEVAIRIDGIVCNDTVDDGDNFLDTMIAEQMEKEDDEESKSSKKSKHSKSSWSSDEFENTPVQLESWVDFNEFKKLDEEIRTVERQKERKMSGSPTSETVGTTGTGSLESVDSSDSKSETDSPGRRTRKSKKQDVELDELEKMVPEDNSEMNSYPPHWDDESLTSYSSRPMTILRKSVNLDFLKTIACEPVLYETDSEAADSWANGEDNTVNSKTRPCLPSSSGAAPTSDPARLAFRNIMNKLPHKSILQRGNLPPPESLTDPRSPRTEANTRVVSPTFSDIMEERETIRVVSIDDDCLDDIVDSEIQEYLEKRRDKSNTNRGKGGQPSGEPGGKIVKQVQQQEKQPYEEGEQIGTKEFRRRKLHRKLAEQQQSIEKQYRNRGKLQQKLNVDAKVRSVLRSRSSDSSSKASKKNLSVSFDDSSISTSSATSLSLGKSTDTPTSSSSSYQSLRSLRGKTIGSQTSAFSAYSGTKQQQQPKYQYTEPEDKPFDEDDDDWINFRTGSSFFSK